MSIEESGRTPRLVGMPEIAAVTRVQRPVVSMWRSRSAASSYPFPAAYERRGQQDLFVADEIAAWLRDTGRGNNPDAADEITAYGIDRDAPHDDPLVFDALTAVLCLLATVPDDLRELDAEELLDLADEQDPDDAAIFRELEQVGERLPVIIDAAVQRADAALSPAAAFEILMADRFRSSLDEHVAVALQPEIATLVARVAVGVNARLDGSATYVDPRPGSSDLLVAVLAEHGERGPAEVVIPSGEGRAERLVRRRMLTHGAARSELDVSADGEFVAAPESTIVTQLPAPGRPRMTVAEVVDALDQIVLQMDDTQRAVVVGPASALTDASGGSAEQTRSALLRGGRVRAIVRLPAGLVTARSRQALALYVLGAPDLRAGVAEDVCWTVDLSDDPIDATTIDELVTDVIVAATADVDLARRHAYTYLNPVPLRSLLSARRLTDAAAGRPLRMTDIVEAARGLQAAYGGLADLSAPMAPGMRTGSGRGLRPIKVTDALDGRHLRVVPGTRLAEEDLGGVGGGLRVIGPDEVMGVRRPGVRAIAALVLAASYPSAGLTEPGDVIFCTAPRPAAIVDDEGSSVVMAPARVLRVDPADPAGLHAEIVAVDINEQPPSARAWRQWRLRRVAEAERSALASTLAAVRTSREAAREQARRLDGLSARLVDGVTSGTVSLEIAGEATPSDGSMSIRFEEEG
ncbi:hypothetical protein CLV56_3536 [Mumia flava]|uniref:Uncharacterized protein n=1 Tax=Mumia flava TaxID=1348852 RepID=A0A0B2BKR0_9ACTN|nr:hypothetical protein [Mumia flava]PJJ54033.1 hypothetical protein CLV56_3536 [Mumia flava]